MTEVLVLLVLGLLVLGPKRLPELARSLGRGLAEFRRASTDMRREFLDVSQEVQSDLFDNGDSEAEKKAVAPGGAEPKPGDEIPAEAAEAADPPTEKTPGASGSG